MSESAIASGRTARMAATASRITAVSRRLTAVRGLNGFTIEQLCEEVGVSRRTFFNYFPSKEEAVIGLDEAEEFGRYAERFLGRDSRGWSSAVDDLLELAVEHARAAGFDVAEHADLVAAIDREPRLLARFIDVSREREGQLAELVATREGTSPRDPHVRAVVQVVSTALRMTGEQFHDLGTADDFAAALADAVAALRTVLTA
ncbi:TetR/AcrR family transcriptional regulator [Agromyces agglutinans]|uniref:TetR/AcrR family transcriptional regulator n=1 Tax=Agromyces agglutinans TaxID=2662258 RepID=UPI001562B9E8|nr:TetR family transcriptional regulator [Agromyces agglutinans]